MLLNNNGVVCDLCGARQVLRFTYFSLDCREVTVSANRQTKAIGRLPLAFSFDVCGSCVAGIERAVTAHYRATAVGINCDLCAAKLSGDFIFYHCDVSKVVVDTEHGMVGCETCGRRRTDCQCGSDNKLVRRATITVDAKYLQLAVCRRDYEVMVRAAVARRADPEITNG